MTHKMAKWARGLVKGVAVVGCVMAGSAFGQTNSLTRTSSFDYDPSTGMLTKEMVEPDLANSCLQTVYSYDVYGNKTSATSGACSGASGNAVASASVARTSSSTYASFGVTVAGVNYTAPAGAFPTGSTNALGQSESKQYDPRWGVLISLTGPNGLTTNWQYDSFGRKTRETRADGTYTSWTYMLCAQSGANCPGSVGNAAPVWVVSEQSYASNAQPNAPQKRQYQDMLDRVVRTETSGFDGNGPAQTIVQDTAYNALGQVQFKTLPYALNAGSPITTTYSYDAIGRVTGQTSADVSQNASFGYNGLNSSVTNANGQTKTTIKNLSGQTAQVIDALGGTVNYSYDALGQLIKTDAAGQITQLTYNQRGQKVAMLDPSMGSWTYDYNVFGELVSQRDSLNQTTTMTYDVLGRMTQRSEPDLLSQWSYDAKFDGSSCGAGVGKLCEAKASNGYQRTHSYDSLGRPVQTATVLDNPSAPAVATTVYETGTGRVASKTWPSTSQGTYQVGYQYTVNGYLSTVTGSGAGSMTASYQILGMDARGQITSYRYGNKITTVNSYESSTGRLSQRQATLDGMAAGAVFSHSYHYDSVNNLTARSDANTGVSEGFSYDSLNRLTQYSAVGGALNAGSSNSLVQVQYDARGNISYKSDVGQYWYDPLRPNRITQVTLNAPAGAVPISGTRYLSHVFDDYANGAQGVNGTNFGNGNLMYTVSLDSVTGRNTVRWESYTSFNMPMSMRYVNLSTPMVSATGSTTAATVGYTCPDGQTLSGSNCLRLGTTTIAQITGYSCLAGQELMGNTCAWSSVQSQTQTMSATLTCAMGWNSAGTACLTLFPGVYIAPTYSCSSGYLVTGTSCSKTTNTIINNSTSATAVYTCAGSQIMTTNGATTTCQSVVSQSAASVSYTCPAGYNLSKQTCLSGSGTAVQTAGMSADRQLDFIYGPEHQRIRQIVSLSANAPSSMHSGTTWYLHGDNNDLFYEKEQRADGTIEHRAYLSAGGITFAIQTIREGNLNGKPVVTLNYMHHDHLGSTAAVTDEAGAVIERMAYDPWGKRRFVNGIADTTDSIVPTSTDRGFTMHEHLDELGIIHMNGRIFDPYTGRFMSADPFIQDAGNLQSYNRYAYVMNNPLAYADPSGYFSLKKLLRTAIAIYAAIEFGTWVGDQTAWSALSSGLSGTQAAWASGIAGGAAGGFAMGAISGGNLNAGINGAFGGALFGWAGTVGGVNGAETPERYLAHAGAGCVSTVAGGGKCGQGMTSALFGKYTTNQIGSGNSWIQGDLAKGVATTIAGGVGSVIAGGKFDNGAATAAMGYLFNYCMHDGHCTTKLEQALWDWMPGYKVGTCISVGNCTGGDWARAVGETALSIGTAGSGTTISGWFRGAVAAEEWAVTRVTSTHIDALASGGIDAAESAFASLPRVGEIAARDIGEGVMVRSVTLEGGGTASLRTFSTSLPSRPTLQINVPGAREIKVRFGE